MRKQRLIVVNGGGRVNLFLTDGFPNPVCHNKIWTFNYLFEGSHVRIHKLLHI